jgi:tRNA dimethylallyltransferase
MRKLLVIGGPTAVGKTGLALCLVKQLNGEMISADSRQVYKYMDIGTGKEKSKINPPTGGQKSKVWLYDLVNPNQKFSVAEYVARAMPVMEDIWQRKKLPILVGGTGFYIKAVIDGIESMGIEPDWELREELAKLSIGELQEKLKGLNGQEFNRMNQSDKNNPRRLIRRMEIIKNLPKVKNLKFKIDNLLMIGLTAPREFLWVRIERRVEERRRQGMEEEIRRLLKKGYTWENSAMGTTLGYREWREYFEGGLSKEAVIVKWKQAEKEYARRQLVWFKKEKRIKWLDISRSGWENRLQRCLKKSNFLVVR